MPELEGSMNRLAVRSVGLSLTSEQLGIRTRVWRPLPVHTGSFDELITERYPNKSHQPVQAGKMRCRGWYFTVQPGFTLVQNLHRVLNPPDVR